MLHNDSRTVDSQNAQLFYFGERLEEIRDDVKDTNSELKEFRKEVSDRNGNQERDITILQEQLKSQGEKIGWLYKGLGLAGVSVIGIIIERVMSNI